jgi:predicted dehydrogenase
MTFKIAVIGCGWVSTACHAPAYQEYARSHENVLLAACCDVDAQRAGQFRDRFGFQHAYTDYREMLEREHPQAVTLNVPPHWISTIGCDVLRRGYPLLAEKPPGLSLEALDDLIAAAASRGVIHQVAFNRRFMPVNLALKGQLAGLSTYHLEIQMARVQRTDENFATTAVHAIDLARFLLDSDYTQASLTYQELPGLAQGVANILLNGRLASGATVHLSIFPVTGVNIERAAIYALDHTFFLQANNGPDSPGRFSHYHKGLLVSEQNAVQLTGRQDDYFLNGFYHEDAAFFDAVQAGRQPLQDFQSCRQSIEIMQGIMQRKTLFSFDDTNANENRS